MEELIIKSNHIKTWLDQIIEHTPRVIAPVRQGVKAEFKSIKQSDEVDYESQTTVSSVKAAAFPPTETLFAYEKEGLETKLHDVASENFVETVIWRARPCDVIGFPCTLR